MSKVIELQYFGNLFFFKKMIEGEIQIEAHENFVKSTYRNRCEISGPDGMLSLTIPIEGGKDVKKLFKEVEIAGTHWKKQHWQSILSCYRRSPYFEYYEDSLKSIFFQEKKYLFEFNKDLLVWAREQLDLNTDLKFTTEYKKKIENDLRSKIKPSDRDSIACPNYMQVFEDRNGFIHNLSIIDLLFNLGPQAGLYLKNWLIQDT